jgi:membrane protein YdbS with pleckstrin-like domain
VTSVETPQTTETDEPARSGEEAGAAAAPAAAAAAAPPSSEPVAAAATAPAPPLAVSDGVQRSLDPRAVPLDRLVGWISTAIFGGIALVAMLLVVLLAPLPGWVDAGLALLWLAFAGILGWFAQRWPAIAHRHTSYRVDADGIEIRRGVVWRAVINVPRSRVQHTDVSQGPLERSHGLGTLVVYTAGTDHARVDLHGLAHEVALAIRDHLLPRALDPEGVDAV